MNSAEVPGWSISRTWSWNCLSTAFLVTLAHQRAHPGADRHAQERDEEQHPEQRAPQHPPGGAASHRVMVGDGAHLALLVADDRRHRVGLDDELLGEALGLVQRLRRRGLVRVADRDQIRHAVTPLSIAVPVAAATAIEPAARTGGILPMG
jgi:hypothetical protein